MEDLTFSDLSDVFSKRFSIMARIVVGVIRIINETEGIKIRGVTYSMFEN